jgi:hypothetical protein
VLPGEATNPLRIVVAVLIVIGMVMMKMAPAA